MSNNNQIFREVREDFPIFSKKNIESNNIIYLDSAATSQKPKPVLDVLDYYYRYENSNVHRGIYTLSENSTQRYEDSRKKISRYIGAKSEKEIVFVKGATEGINLVAHSYLYPRLEPGDEIILSIMEHHANIVPWQIIAEKKKAKIHVIDIDDKGDLNWDQFCRYLNPKTKMLALTHVSNVLGTVNPVKDYIKAAHSQGAKVLIDGAQALSHGKVDVDDLGADFYTFSAHKCLGPNAIGVLYAPYDILESMIPYQSGGSMIQKVSFDKTTYADPPLRFEPGTPNVAGVIAMAEALDYVESIGHDKINDYEQYLSKYLHEILNNNKRIKVYGESKGKAPIASFSYDGVHPHDIATILDSEGICVRAGHHCAMPLSSFLGVNSTTRASLSFYNNLQDLISFEKALAKVEKLFYG